MKLAPLLLLAVACDGPGEPFGDPPPSRPYRCTGRWLTSVDDVPEAEGFEVRDQEDRIVEEAWDPVGSEGVSHTWRVWETDASGTDRLVEERIDDEGDDEADRRIAYSYVLDEELRLASISTRSHDQPERIETFTYDADDQLVAAASTWGDAFTGAARFTWSDGRLDLTENLGPGGQVVSTLARDHLEPAPSLDRLETLDWNGTVTVARYDHDAAGQLLASWAVGDEGETLLLTQAWDDEGRLVDAVSTWPTGPLWGDEVGETRTTWAYGDDGRIRTVRSEDDALAAGTVEHVEVTEWSWVCR